MITLVTLDVVFNGRSLTTVYGFPGGAHSLGVAAARFKHRSMVPCGMIVEHGADLVEAELDLATDRIACELHGAWDTIPMF